MENRPLQPSSDSSQPQRLEIAHVLFADIVAYSRLPIERFVTKEIGPDEVVPTAIALLNRQLVGRAIVKV